MPAPAPLPPLSILHECFEYDPQTGDLRWRERPDDHFPSLNIARTWRTRFAGKIAGSPTEVSSDKRLWQINLAVDGVRLRLFAHRVAFKLMTGRDPDGDVSHRNGDTLDNRWCNLREITRSELMATVPSPAGRSLPRGVSVNGLGFSARIRDGSKTRHLGTFPTPEEAHAVYCVVGRRLRGPFFNGRSREAEHAPP